MVDTAAEAESSRLGSALVELEADGIAYGDLALTVALHGDLARTERLDAELRRIFAGCDAKVIREGYGQLPTWFARMPAMPRRRQIRSVFASAGVAACLAPLFGPPKGEPVSRHLGEARPRHLRDPVADALLLRPLRRRRGPHADPRGHRRGQELPAQLPPRPEPPVRPPGAGAGPRRLLPLAHPVPRRRLPPARPRPRGRRARPQAVHAAPRRADLPVPHRLGDPAAPDRRPRALRRRPLRDPRPDRGPLRLRAGGPFALRLRQVAAEADVAGDEPLARRRGVGRVPSTTPRPRRSSSPTGR